ncbi:uncharacterized protein LOC108950243 [Ciona intestinalis]
MSLGLSMYDSSSDEDETTEMGGVKCVVSSQKRKILAPKRGVDSDEDEPSIKMKKDDAAPKVGLFAKLPAPRNTIGSGKQTERPLIPHVFRRKEEVKKKAPVEVKTIKKKRIEEESESETEEESVSFFSFVDKKEKEEKTTSGVDVPSTTKVLPSVDSNPELPDIPAEAPAVPVEIQQVETHEEHTSTAIPENFQKDESFLRIQGKKFRNEKIEFVDYNADSVLAGNKELLLKSISEEKNLNRQSHSKKNSNQPSATQKRKSQLTYLIHQAQEREIELKNAWASGRASRQATRNKYGF